MPSQNPAMEGTRPVLLSSGRDDGASGRLLSGRPQWKSHETQEHKKREHYVLTCFATVVMGAAPSNGEKPAFQNEWPRGPAQQAKEPLQWGYTKPSNGSGRGSPAEPQGPCPRTSN